VTPACPKPEPKIKKRKCLICRNQFMPFSTTQTTCQVQCAIELAVRYRIKRNRKEKKHQLEALKPLREHLKDTQSIVNTYIRKRDNGLPCISCNKLHKGKMNAGHYRTVKAAPQLRFNEENIHGQCEPCNSYLSGNITEYRINLVKKIGRDRVEDLENNNEIIKYTIEDAKRIKKEYKEKIKALLSLQA